MQVKGFIVTKKVNQQPTMVEVEGDEVDLKTLQHHVGGCIELVDRDDHFDVWGNEDFLTLSPEDQGFNYEALSSDGHWNKHFIRGPIVVSGFNSEGDSIPLTEAQAAEVMAMLKKRHRQNAIAFRVKL